MSPAATLVLAAIPSPDRGVWNLGPIPIRAYALCIILGVVLAVAWGERRMVARGGQRGMVTDIAVFAVPFGLVGGRIYHVITDWQTYFGPGGNPVDALKIWQGGLGIWGAIALGGVGAWIGCRRRGVPLPVFADAVAPGIVVAQAVGRLGNWFNQELYGAPTTLPWGLEIYRRVDPATGVPDPLGGVALDRTPIEVVHPTFLYELLWNLVVAAIVVLADRRFRLGHGRAFAVYVAGYTFGRFFIEMMRTDYATRVFGDLRVNVVVSAVVFLAAIAYLVLAPRGREVLADPARGDGDGDGDGDRDDPHGGPDDDAGDDPSAEQDDADRLATVGAAPGARGGAAAGATGGAATGAAAGAAEPGLLTAPLVHLDKPRPTTSPTGRTTPAADTIEPADEATSTSPSTSPTSTPGSGTASTPEITPHATASAGAMPDGATAPEGAAPGGTAPDGTAPDDTVPDDTVPDDAVPDDAVPGGAAPGGPTGDRTP